MCSEAPPLLLLPLSLFTLKYNSNLHLIHSFSSTGTGNTKNKYKLKISFGSGTTETHPNRVCLHGEDYFHRKYLNRRECSSPPTLVSYLSDVYICPNKWTSDRTAAAAESLQQKNEIKKVWSESLFSSKSRIISACKFTHKHADLRTDKDEDEEEIIRSQHPLRSRNTNTFYILIYHLRRKTD